MSERSVLTNSNSMAIDTDNSNNSNDNNNSSSSSSSITTATDNNAGSKNCKHMSAKVWLNGPFHSYGKEFVCPDCYKSLTKKYGINSNISLNTSVTMSNGITTGKITTISKNCQNQSSSSSKCSLNSSPSSMSSEVVYITQTGPWFWL